MLIVPSQVDWRPRFTMLGERKGRDFKPAGC
jgi:hypothetical protein